MRRFQFGRCWIWIGLGVLDFAVVLSCFVGFGNVGVFWGDLGVLQLASNQGSSSCRCEVCRDGYPKDLVAHIAAGNIA